MLKNLLLCMLMLLVACNEPTQNPPNSPNGEPPIIHEPEPAPTPEPPSTVEVPPPVEGATLKVNIKLTNATKEQAAKYNKAIEIFKKVTSSAEFKKRVLASRYAGKPGFASSSATPQQVFDKLMSGAEKLQPEKDKEVDLEVRFYYANNSTVGYTYPNVKYIMVNTKFFNGFKSNSVAANLLHEYMHKLGYGHDSARTARRPYSVPYALGNIMTTLGAKYL